MPHTLQHLADLVGGEVYGDPDCVINGVATLNNASAGRISFLTNPKYKNQLQQTRASAVIIPASCRGECPTNAIIVDNPHAAYARVASALYPEPPVKSGVHHTAVVADNAQVDASASIGANVFIAENVNIGARVRIDAGCVIEAGVSIGADSHICSNVTICRECVIGERVLLHPGVVIGADGFGQANDNGHWLKVPQLGCVRLGDDVEIGANTTVDRGSIGDTLIGNGVKLDNLIQIGHNVEVGDHTVMAACTAVAGSTKIGRHCVIAGAVGIIGHIEIVDNVTITGMSMISKSIGKPGVYSGSLPAAENRKWLKQIANMRHLDDLQQRLKIIEQQISKM